MNKEDIKFKISSLERSKIIMATEMVGVNAAVAVGIFLADRYLTHQQLKDVLIILGGLFGISYSLYASFGNVQKHLRIKALEKELEKVMSKSQLR